MSSQPLSELGAELDLILEYLDSEDIADLQAAEDLLDDLIPQLDTKVDGYAGAIAHYETISGNIDAEIRRLEVRKEKIEYNRDYLKRRLKTFLELRIEQLGSRGKKIEGNLYRISLCANGGKQSVYINPIAGFEFVPSELVVTTITEKIDTDNLREYFATTGTTKLVDEEGTFIAELLPRGSHLRIT